MIFNHPQAILLHICVLCYISYCVGFISRSTVFPGRWSNRPRMSALYFDRSRKSRIESLYTIPSIYNVEDDPLIPIVETIVKAADSRKARQMAAIRISQLTNVAHFVIIIEGMISLLTGYCVMCAVLSRSQSDAIVDDIEVRTLVMSVVSIIHFCQKKMLQVHNLKPIGMQGKSNSGWQAIEYGTIFYCVDDFTYINSDDVLINVMSTEMMNHYQLDRLWKRGEFLDLSYLRQKTSKATNATAAGSAGSRERQDWSDPNLRRLVDDIGSSEVLDAHSDSNSNEESAPLQSDKKQNNKELSNVHESGPLHPHIGESSEEEQALDPFWS